MARERMGEGMIPDRYIEMLVQGELTKARPPAPGQEKLKITMPHWDEGVDMGVHWLPRMVGKPEPFRMSPGFHSHNYFELMYVERGVFHNAVDGEDMVLTDKTIAVIGPDIPHNPYVERNSDIIINVMISPKLMDGAYQFIYGARSDFSAFLYNYIYGLPNGAQHLMIPRNAAIDAVVERLVELYLDRPPMAAERMRVMTAQLLVELCQSYNAASAERDANKDAQLSDIIKYMRANYTTVTLNRLSEVFHYSTAHLSRMISQGMNRSFRELCMDYKAEGARKLLAYTDLSVAEIASNLNIADPGYLSKLIKAESGLSPTEYRKKYSRL